MSQKMIVVADDEFEVASVLKMILETEGYGVVAVNDGMSALAAIRENRPHLALLDVMMPRLEGHEVCRFVKHESDLQDTKVMMLTALSDDHDLESARSAGADSYITKPFAVNSLLQEVGRLLA